MCRLSGFENRDGDRSWVGEPSLGHRVLWCRAGSWHSGKPEVRVHHWHGLLGGDGVGLQCDQEAGLWVCSCRWLDLADIQS